MNCKKKYKVTFKGVIYPGFDKDQIIENIHQISRVPKEIISRKFFSGKTVVIRHADSRDYANRLQKTFGIAGIETYITEDFEDVNENKLKLSYIVIAIIVIAVPVSYFVLTDSEIKNTIITSESIIPEVITPEAIEPEAITAETIIPETISEINSTVIEQKITSISHSENVPKPPSPLLNTENIRLLIKITDKHELKYLTQFIHLFEFSQKNSELLLQAIQQENSSLIISQEKPLYVFQTDQYSGMFSSKNNDFSSDFISQIENKISDEYNKNNCNNKPLQLINTKNHIFLSNNADLEISKKIKYLSKNNYLTNQFLKFDTLFSDTKKKFPASFYVYYSNKNKTSYFSLLYNNSSFMLRAEPETGNKNNELFNYFKIRNNEPNKVSSLKKLSLFQLTLLLIAQDKFEDLLQKENNNLEFKAEQIISIKDGYSSKFIKDYQNKLDIEFNPQWQSGPFAITTNKLLFKKQLIIELLAKGQNIENLMEYSHTASINSLSVLNDKGENILHNNCQGDNSNISYFKDHEGEQEAYLNNDFVSYKTITATNQIAIKPGFDINNVSLVEGKIILQLPGKILSENIDISSLHGNEQIIKVLDNFSIILKAYPQENRLEYRVIGDNNKFITLRAINKTGEIIDTRYLQKHSIINNQLSVYLQEFLESVSSIQVFYTRQTKLLTYPFSFQPSIEPGSISLNEQGNMEIAFDAVSKDDKFKFDTLDQKILQDNPSWLGKQIASSTKHPFYISLFMRNDGDEEIIHDAVFNIKSNNSPYIKQNLSAVRLSLISDKKTYIDNFVSFTVNELINNEAIDISEAAVTAEKVTPYLNSNSAFQINKEDIKTLHGNIKFNLPTSFKFYSYSYSSPGQIIKSDNLMVTLMQINKHQIQFNIKGKLDNLVQLKLYNKQNNLISKPLEFKHVNNDNALLTLQYNDKIDSIKLVLAKESIVRSYPFSFKLN